MSQRDIWRVKTESKLYARSIGTIRNTYLHFSIRCSYGTRFSTFVLLPKKCPYGTGLYCKHCFRTALLRRNFLDRPHLIYRFISLSTSLDLIVSRLSKCFLPLARPISTLARLLSLKKIRRGTNVYPFSFNLASIFFISLF